MDHPDLSPSSLKDIKPVSSSVPLAVWRRLDCEGLDSARLEPWTDGVRLRGAASFQHDGAPALLHYTVECDRDWRTRSAWVEGLVSGAIVRHRVEVSMEQRWSLDGWELPALEGCIDVDLNFSPITNTLPIRRLSLGPGESARVNAAWLRFPSFTVDKLDQVYQRTGTQSYHYESASGQFHAEVTVDEHGLVRDYSPFWARVE